MRISIASLLGLLVLCVAPRANAAITVYPRVGNAADSTAVPQGPGLVVMGGGSDVDGAFVWMHDAVVGSKSATGADVVVLRATGDNAYDSYIAGLAPFNSVQTLLIPTPASANDLSTAAAIVDKAEVVFFAGGNQADYVGWQGSPLVTAVGACYQRGGIVGGTSAGSAILGEFVYDSIKAGSTNVATADAVANPYEATLSFTHAFLPFGLLADAVTDPHFVTRDRFGRLAVFMARQLADGLANNVVHGIGVDEGAALCIDKTGLATLKQFTAGTGAAFILSGGPAATIVSGKPLRYPNITVTRLDQDGQTYDVSRWCGTTTTYLVTVDGAMMPVYSPADPYTASGSAGVCDTSSPDLATAAPEDMASGSTASSDGSVLDAARFDDGGNGIGGGAGGAPDPAGACGCRIGGRSSNPSVATVMLVFFGFGVTLLRRRARRTGA